MTLEAIFIAASLAYGVPDGLLSSLCFVESSHRIAVRKVDSNGRESLGVCQIQKETAQDLGFEGTKKDLMAPEINIFWSAFYLSKQHERYGSWIKAVKAYNAGSTKNSKHNTYSWRVFHVRELQRKSRKGPQVRPTNPGTGRGTPGSTVDTHR